MHEHAGVRDHHREGTAHQRHVPLHEAGLLRRARRLHDAKHRQHVAAPAAGRQRGFRPYGHRPQLPVRKTATLPARREP